MVGKFNAADFSVFAVCELFAIPICHAGWEGVVSGEHLTNSIVALIFGVPIGLIGASFHWWKDQLPDARDWITRQADRWWPVALLVAFAYAAGPTLYQRTFPSTATLHATGRIAWNIEQAAQGGAYFLNMIRLNDQEIRILGFQAHGKNNSNDPITEFSGYIRSDATNARRPIYLQAQDQEENKTLACLPHPWIPTLPDQTFGIPPLADFEIGTYDKPYAELGKDGIPLSQFLNTFRLSLR